MEKKDIFLVAAVVGAVCILIALISAIRGEEPEVESSLPELPAVSDIIVTATQTDYWDYLRQQQETTVTTVTDEYGNPVLPDETDLTGDETGVLPDETGFVPEETTTTEAVSTLAQTEGQQGFTIQVQ